MGPWELMIRPKLSNTKARRSAVGHRTQATQNTRNALENFTTEVSLYSFALTLQLLIKATASTGTFTPELQNDRIRSDSCIRVYLDEDFYGLLLGLEEIYITSFYSRFYAGISVDTLATSWYLLEIVMRGKLS